MADLYNRDVVDVVNWLKDIETEMCASQSSRLHRGFIAGEKRRYVELLEAIMKRVTVMEPEDFPETHPIVLVANQD